MVVYWDRPACLNHTSNQVQVDTLTLSSLADPLKWVNQPQRVKSLIETEFYRQRCCFFCNTALENTDKINVKSLNILHLTVLVIKYYS